MKKYKIIVAFYIVFFSLLSYSQQQDTLRVKSALYGNLNEQFDFVFKKSVTYETNKIVSNTLFEHLKKSSLDSLRLYKNELDRIQNIYESILVENDSLKEKSQAIEQELAAVNTNKKVVSVVGLSVNKSIFNIFFIVFGTLLILLLVVFVLKFKNAKSQADVAVENLSKTEEEFADYKRKSMEKEQILGRKLQDEINKNKSKSDNS